MIIASRMTMHRTFLTLFAAAALAACGSKAKPTSTPDLATSDPQQQPPSDDATVDPPHDDHAAPEDPPQADPAQVKADLLAAETSAYQAAKPVFEKYCAACHQQGGRKASAKKLGHFDMTPYPFAGHHAMEVSGEIREVLGIGGGKPTMPADKPGAVKGDELALIAAWADAFDASHAGGAHAGTTGHDHGGHKH